MATSTGGLSLSRMREEFRNRVPDLVASPTFSDGKVDEFLNGAHRFTVPTEVPGDYKEGIWGFNTVQGVAVYPFRPHEGDFTIWVHSLWGPVFVEDYEIRSYRKPSWFWWYEPPSTPTSGRPYSALIHAAKLELRPVPDQAYTIRCPGELYPNALTTDGVSYRPRALAVVCMAAAEAARSFNHGDLAAEIEGEAGMYLDQCRTQSLATPRSRVPRRSF